MSYNITEQAPYFYTAGKVTILTTVVGLFVFAFIFLFNVGQNEFHEALAENASTSVTVLNTPPYWSTLAYEVVESSTSTPTNSDDQVQWTGQATDYNNEDYWMLICSNSATPTPGTSVVEPTCGAGATTWGVSTVTSSGAFATVATTTTEAFSEQNDWYAWICDAIDLNSRCNATYSTGLNATNSSPFYVNHRPTFSAFGDDSPTEPNQTVTFYATSSDSDTITTADTMQLIVCNEADYNSVTNQCGAGGTIATSTFSASNPTATFTIPTPTQDQTYTAYGYIVDEHGHEASGGAQGTDAALVVANSAPTVAAASISLNGGNPIILTEEQAETTGFTLSFVVTDNNSCDAAGGGAADEVTGYVLSVYRSGVGSTTCDGATGTYDPNNCYVSSLPTSIWNLSCTASSTSCSGATDPTIQYDCTFPLWYIADPTDGVDITESFYFAEEWTAEVRAIDDDSAIGTSSEAASGVELNSLLAMALNTAAIPYGELEPGADTGTLSATTSVSATGNVGLDQNLQGQSMCTTYTSTSTCPVSASSTIPVNYQEFATSELSYGAGTPLASSTQQELELNVNKTISTSTPASKLTYWGIGVPGTITLAGLYTGENTITAVKSEPIEW